MSLKDIIEKLPPELKEIADLYLPLLTGMADNEIKQWIDNLLRGDWQTAYRLVVSKMTTEQLLAEQTRINKKLKAISEKDAANEEIQKQLITDLLNLVLKLGLAAVAI